MISNTSGHITTIFDPKELANIHVTALTARHSSLYIYNTEPSAQVQAICDTVERHLLETAASYQDEKFCSFLDRYVAIAALQVRNLAEYNPEEEYKIDKFDVDVYIGLHIRTDIEHIILSALRQQNPKDVQTWYKRQGADLADIIRLPKKQTWEHFEKDYLPTRTAYEKAMQRKEEIDQENRDKMRKSSPPSKDEGYQRLLGKLRPQK